jgi:hypothetical protein
VKRIVGVLDQKLHDRVIVILGLVVDALSEDLVGIILGVRVVDALVGRLKRKANVMGEVSVLALQLQFRPLNVLHGGLVS